MNRQPPPRKQPMMNRPGHYWHRDRWYPYHYWYWNYPDYDYYDDLDLYDYYYHFDRYDVSRDAFNQGFRAGLQHAQKQPVNKEAVENTQSTGYCGSMGA